MFNLTTDGEEQPDPAMEIKVLRVRVQMAQAWASLTRKAYDAMRSYGVDYQSLPEYHDTTLIDEGNKLNLVAGQEKFMEWMRRVEHGIEAAVRRKQFILHNRPKGLH